MSKTLEQTRDELAAEQAEFSEKSFSTAYGALEAGFKYGFDACVKFLSEQAGEFDVDAFNEWFCNKGFVDCEESARWQFEQDRKRIGLAELNYRIMENWREHAVKQAKDLTARLEQAGEEVPMHHLDLIQKLKASQQDFKARAEKAERERDAYAKAMAIALREGIFANKEGVKREIEQLLKERK